MPLSTFYMSGLVWLMSLLYKTIGDIDMKGALDDGEKAVEHSKTTGD